MRIGFVGLGGMGRGMAQNLLKAGHEVVLYNRTRSRAEAISGAGARIAATPAEAATSAQAVVTMLADDQAVETVAFGEAGFVAALPRGALHISSSTISVSLTEGLTRTHAQGGQQFVAAPVFGRPEAAEQAQLFVVAAGAPAAIAASQPIFDAIGQKTFVVGEQPRMAAVVKLSGNFLIANVIESLAEAVTLVRKYGVDPENYLELLTGTLFGAPVYKTYGAKIARADYEPVGFRMPLGLKDIRLALAAAEAVSVPMPVAGVIRDHMISALAQGMENADWSAFARIVARNAGLEPA
jgi:3-hydroxyisobutyrate dehydrogenase-like beta-hydroxyacid dehydrogenase